MIIYYAISYYIAGAVVVPRLARSPGPRAPRLPGWFPYSSLLHVCVYIYIYIYIVYTCIMIMTIKQIILAIVIVESNT